MSPPLSWDKILLLRNLVAESIAAKVVLQMPVFFLSDAFRFPNPRYASQEGLLAVGGDLDPQRILLAYRQGIFPWYSKGEPILWWSPDPRLVLFPHEFKISKSLKRVINQSQFEITFDREFQSVISECAEIREERKEATWIGMDMIEAYCQLHAMGYAHSVEAWQNKVLVGGLYGVSLGSCFFGESMFTRVSNASKMALTGLIHFLRSHQFDLIDCQVTTDHLISMGAREISRNRFLGLLQASLKNPTMQGKWK